MSGLFGLKWLTPELIAMGGLAAATGGAALPALGAAGTAGAAGAAGAGTAGLLGAAAPVAEAAGTFNGLSAAAGQGLNLAKTAGTGLNLAGVTAPESAGLLDTLGGYGKQAMGYVDEANKVLKPIGTAANAAGAVQGLFPQSAPVQTPAPQFGGGAGSQAFTGLLQQSMQTDQQRLQDEMKRRETQQKLIGLIGGM